MTCERCGEDMECTCHDCQDTGCCHRQCPLSGDPVAEWCDGCREIWRNNYEEV